MIKNAIKVLVVLFLAVTTFSQVKAAEKKEGQQIAAQSQLSKVDDTKTGMSTDLGKGLPYNGLTPAEQQKLDESLKHQSGLTSPKISKAQGLKTKPAPNLTSSPLGETKSSVVSLKSKPPAVKTYLGEGKSYPGLSAQEKEKYQTTGGR